MIFPLKPPFMVGIFHGDVSHNQMVSLGIGNLLLTIYADEALTSGMILQVNLKCQTWTCFGF